MSLLRTLVPFILLLGHAAAGLAQTCPTGIPRVAPDSRYSIDAINGVVTDLRTGLMWKRCSEGQTHTSGTCTGSASAYTWAQASGLAGAAFAGSSDWRLPNREELRSLVETGCHSPAINTLAFPVTPSLFGWSSTTVASNVAGAWRVDFLYGNSEPALKVDAHTVRLVRGGQSLDAFRAEGDSTPDAFTLTAQTGVPLSSERTSAAITVAGLTAVTGIGVSGASGSSYSINGGAFTSQPGAVANGDTVQVRHTSAATGNTTTITTLTIGGVTGGFVSVTLAVDPIFADGFDPAIRTLSVPIGGR